MSTGCQKDKKTDRTMDIRKHRKTFFSFVIKTKIVPNVNRMSKDGQTDTLPGKQTEQQTKKENYRETDRMTV